MVKFEENSAQTADMNSGFERKIIYTADVALVVADLTELEAEIPNLVTQFGGYMSDVSISRTQGVSRTSHWTVRIPADQFEAFLAAVSNFGVPETRRQTAEDVTEEFVDLDARISTKKQLEQRIVNLLEKSAADITKVIEVERELARVRTDIEQMEGRRRYLLNRTALTTVKISAREEKDYVPPQSPTYTARVAKAWNDSVSTLRQFSEHLSIVIVALFPWRACWRSFCSQPPGTVGGTAKPPLENQADTRVAKSRSTECVAVDDTASVGFAR